MKGHPYVSIKDSTFVRIKNLTLKVIHLNLKIHLTTESSTNT